MATEESVREKILRLKEKNACVHVNYHNTFPKVTMLNVPAVIGNVYAHLFELSYEADGHRKVKSYTFAELICHRIEIVELEM